MFGLNSFIKVLEVIQEHIEKEYYDENKVKKELLRLRLKYEMEEIDVEEYTNREKQLIQRMMDIREYKKKLIEDEEDTFE
ncbi:gas vesicle protein GvpG [Marinisporobacter balticus]|uniref:Gas vesicle protein GvpG n=1 Tax=Marinisporobacter balticus TaxID=2018667 RepID=A0A4R2LF68_9FIRM|nr:gas vesicle protein GvpG [Marinisporobacter balticus]TCO77905.1 gas vesicle protein GvpG [Marinisporobacter balticus]